MFAKLTMKLKADEPLTFQKSSAFQGALLEQVDPVYAEELHQQQMRPYSQYVTRWQNENIWTVCTLTDEAYEKIIEPLMKPAFSQVYIKNGNIDAEILSKELHSQSSGDLLNSFLNQRAARSTKIEVLTPTAFKQAGHYCVLPDVRLIFQSLMNRFSLISDEYSMIDEETLEQLEEMTYVTGYRLRTTGFSLEKVRMPGFIGTFTIRTNGPETMARYVRMLLSFGEYSGIGIRTAMGMGAIRFIGEGVPEECVKKK